MSDVRLYVHAVWGVKNRYPTLSKSEREKLFEHIRENAKEKNIEIQEINGHVDHVHCLIRLKATQAIAPILQLIKGESSHWANQRSLFEKQLTWARSYYVRSVDEKNVYIVKRYISNQQKHKNPFGDVKDYLERLSKNEDEDKTTTS
jgi:putative transposase